MNETKKQEDPLVNIYNEILREPIEQNDYKYSFIDNGTISESLKAYVNAYVACNDCTFNEEDNKNYAFLKSNIDLLESILPKYLEETNQEKIGPEQCKFVLWLDNEIKNKGLIDFKVSNANNTALKDRSAEEIELYFKELNIINEKVANGEGVRITNL